MQTVPVQRPGMSQPLQQAAAPVDLAADLRCLPSGGAAISLTIRNLGRETLRIAGDIHLTLSAVRPGGPEGVSALFIFPAPGADVVAPGGEQTFWLITGEPTPGKPDDRLSARRLIVEAEVWFEGRDAAVRRHFSFPGCGA